jgi:hypothetical protein
MAGLGAPTRFAADHSRPTAQPSAPTSRANEWRKLDPELVLSNAWNTETPRPGPMQGLAAERDE